MADPIEDFNTRWIVKEHIIPASHIRGFARGIRLNTQATHHSQKQPLLRLAVKQYTPRSNPDPAPGDPTIILAHGVGSSKESYEPLLDALLTTPSLRRTSIRSVWIPDVAWHGASYLLNRAVLGDQPHWDDTARDLVQLANHFQAEMPAPVLGISQSWGAWALLRAAAFHPRLFAGLVLMEPTLVSSYPVADEKEAAEAEARAEAAGSGRSRSGSGSGGTLEEGRSGGGTERRSGSGSGSGSASAEVAVKGTKQRDYARGMMFKRDTWPSRKEAISYLLANPYYGAFDPAVFARVARYDLIDVDAHTSKQTTPTSSPSSSSSPAVTLTTPKSMEVYTMMRPWPPLPTTPPEDPDHSLTRLAEKGTYEPNMVTPGFHRHEPSLIGRGPHISPASHPSATTTLTDLLPPVQLVWAGRGFASLRQYRRWLVETIGSGADGSGGAARGKVVEAVVQDSGHPLPLERPRDAAAVVGPWLEARVREWKEEDERIRRGPPQFVEVINPAWVERASKL